jgi:hypothetical protein
MSRECHGRTAIENEMSQFELVEELQRVIDRNFRRLLETARNNWERNFAGKDPSDACVSVRTHSAETAIKTRAVPSSGFLKGRKPSRAKQRSSLPRFA